MGSRQFSITFLSTAPAVVAATLCIAVTSPAVRADDEEPAAVEDPFGLEVAVEIVGGVEVAAEPEGDEGSEEDADAEKGGGEEDRPELPPGESILADLDFDPGDERYEEKVAELFLAEDALGGITKQIADLDSEDFRLRNEASKQLAMVQAPIEHLLGAARDGAGIEMSRRIQGILNVRVKQRRVDALYHAAAKIAADEEPGFVARLLTMASTFDPGRHWDLLRMLELAVAKSAREQDREILQAALGGGSAATAELAAFASGFRVSQEDQGGGTRPDLIGDDELLRLAFARGRAAAGDGVALGELVSLLEAKNLRVRHEAGLLLRRIHGRDFGYAAYDGEARRAAAIGRWENFASNFQGGDTVGEVVLGIGARGAFRVLVGNKPGKQGSVLAFTTSGKKIGEHALAAAMGGINPTRIAFDQTAGLIVASGGGDADGRVAVFSEDGTELWNASGIPAGGGCAPVAGGRLLVAIGKEVEEIDVTGDRVGVWSLGEKTVSFGRMRKGRFLCAHPDKGAIAEYGDEGKILWRRNGFHYPERVERLPNGNLLVVVRAGDPPADGEDDPNAASVGPELLEVSPDGNEIIARVTPKSVKRITCAARLPNGNTLLGTEKGLAEYTPEGYAVKVWLKNAISSIHVR